MPQAWPCHRWLVAGSAQACFGLLSCARRSVEIKTTECFYSWVFTPSGNLRPRSVSSSIGAPFCMSGEQDRTAVTCPWGGTHPTRSSNAESLEKSTWDLKTQVLRCLWVHPTPISEAISFLFFDLPKGVVTGACVCVLGAPWPVHLDVAPGQQGDAGRRTFLLLGAPGARVDRYVEHQWSAGQDGLPMSSTTSSSSSSSFSFLRSTAQHLCVAWLSTHDLRARGCSQPRSAVKIQKPVSARSLSKSHHFF